jgi:hypothetical protein
MLDILLSIVGFIGAIYVFYIIYGGDGPNIDDDDLDRVIKGGDKG